MRPSQFIARLVTEKRLLVWAVVLLISAGSFWILKSRIALDSDIINMLPGNFTSVQGLKIYNKDFEQTRELTFALVCQPQDVDRLEEYTPTFANILRHQAWCERLLAGSPMETPEGVHDLQTMAVPLLLNLDPPKFDQTLQLLQNDKMRERLHRLQEQIQAGSPRPQFELEFDPLGLIGPAIRPFAEGNAVQEDQPLASPDRTMRVFLVVTNQKTPSAFDAQNLMKRVNKFCKAPLPGWDGGPIQLLVTGRSAYVSEISLSMRHDVVVTMIGSIILVAAIFFVGFQRWLPLAGMAFALALSCLVGLALGLLIFGELNMVTVGFSAILVGLGVDFAILVFGRYQQARGDGESHQQAVETAVAKLGRAVFFGALTTAVGFLALVLSGSLGFSELGVLIAIGILLAGLFMCTILFLFIPREQKQIRHDWLFEAVKRYVCWAVRKPKALLTGVLILLVGLSVVGFFPFLPVPFDSSTRSLEPKQSKASQALATIMSKMPARWEPVLALVQAKDAQELSDAWHKAAQHWSELQKAGKIKGYSTPAALALSPKTMNENRAKLDAINFDQVKENLGQTLDAEGFSRGPFAVGFTMLDDLKKMQDPKTPMPHWRDHLPRSSSWWFLIDRYFARDPLLTTGFVTTNAPITRHATYEELSKELPVPGISMTFSGWSYTLADLLPWSRHQLLLISALMALFDAILLAILYRDWRLWIIQELTLLFAVGAMLATMKIFNIPLNLLNVLSFRLVLAIGVDYGIYIVLIWQKAHDLEHDVAGVVKPVLLAGLTAVSGFGSLGIARNPSLSSLGIACAIGIFWSLFATLFFTLPAAAVVERKSWPAAVPDDSNRRD